MPLYTPFFERGMATIEQGRERGATRDAAKSAYMSGDLSGLYAQNPELANQMEGRQLQRQQVEGQNAATQQRAEQARAASERQAERDRLADEEASNAFYNQMAGEVANIDDFETAKAYAADQINRSPYKEDYDIETFTPEQHEQYKQVANEKDPVTRQRTEEIANITPQLVEMGIDPEQALTTATNIVDDNVTFEMTDQGRAISTNKITGEVTEIQIGGGEIEDTGPNDQPFSLYGMSSQTSGPESSTKAFATKVGAMFEIDGFPETVTNRQVADAAVQGLVKSLSINDKYPVKEIERIREDMAKISPTFFSGGKEVRAQMKGLHILLSNALKQAEADLSNPRMPDDMRGAAFRQANDISDFLEVMGYVDADILSSPEVVMATPMASLEEFIRSSSEAELAQLSDEAEEAIFQRFNNASTK